MAEILGAKWLWLPIFFGYSVFISFAFALWLGWIGVLIPHIPSILFITKEAIRKSRLKYPTECWETGDIEALVRAYAEEQNQKKAQKAEAG